AKRRLFPMARLSGGDGERRARERHPLLGDVARTRRGGGLRAWVAWDALLRAKPPPDLGNAPLSAIKGGTMYHADNHRRAPTRTTRLARAILVVASVWATVVTAGQSFAQSTESWMTALPDTRLLSQMSIPGTHDTCAL